MSPVFRHGRLRLYLLKLLDESPRHGYEVIRLLQDRFLGVYAPSPGTIYPRLARLEEEGLVTHDEENGRKVYRITGKGREELRARADDLAELEEEITASVRDIAEEVSEDVRATVRTLREELTSAAREMRGSGGSRRAGREDVWRDASTERDEARQQAAAAGRRARAERERARREAEDERTRARSERSRAREQRDEARAQRGAPEGGQPPPGDGGEGSAAGADSGGGQRGRGAWSDWAGWAGHRGQPGRGWGDPRAYQDMDRLARQFTREFHRAAEQAQAVGEGAVASLRDILGDTLDRIRTEVFGEPGQSGPPSGGAGDSGQHPGDAGTGGTGQR